MCSPSLRVGLEIAGAGDETGDCADNAGDDVCANVDGKENESNADAVLAVEVIGGDCT